LRDRSLTVQRAILEIDSRGLDVEGIYRIPGKLGLIQQVVQEIEQDEFAFEFDPERHDVHTVAGVLKVSQSEPQAKLSVLTTGALHQALPSATARGSTTDRQQRTRSDQRIVRRGCFQDAVQETTQNAPISSSNRKDADCALCARAQSLCGEQDVAASVGFMFKSCCIR
jgi:hypothetical protein